jgi:hypothetical protein
MVTACRIDLEMEIWGTLLRVRNRDHLTSLAVFNHTKQRNHQTAHKSKNKSNSRIKKTEVFLKPAKY